MNQKMRINTIELLPGDVPAILAALDLVATAEADSNFQNRLNYLNCASAAEKLKENQCVFSPNELRVLFVGVGFAIDLVSGIGNSYVSMDELEPEWQADLKKNLFVYNRLYPQLAKLTSKFDSDL